MASDKCSLTFYTETTELQDALDRVAVSEEAVARQQVEEDMRLYGARPEPSDITADPDNDDNAQLARLPLKRNASNVMSTTGRPAKTRKIYEDDGPGNQTLTAMDWNSGASPLEAWLNQSAIPSVAPTQVNEDATSSIVSLVAQEKEEIKRFRSVHLPATESPNINLLVDKEFSSLRQEAQIYYRNIRDKFALIPPYLAHRLAEANLDRATALQSTKCKLDLASSPTQPPASKDGVNLQSDTARTPMGGTTLFAAETAFPAERGLTIVEDPIGQGLEAKPLRRQSYDSKLHSTTTGLETQSHIFQTDRRYYHTLVPGVATKLEKPPIRRSITRSSRPSAHQVNNSDLKERKVLSEGFWNGGPPSRRPSSTASIHSRSSSMNSLLQESPKPDLYQHDDFVPSSPPGHPRGLPPPPVDLKKQKSFVCDLCGETVRVERRRQWQ